MSRAHRSSACPQCAAPGDAASDVPEAGATATVSDRVHALALDIVHRLRPVCAHMPDGELLALATEMATVELTYFERSAEPRTLRRRAAQG
jgi:hypothetical protein